MRFGLALLGAAVALAAVAASAGDGVLEINLTCATTAGCFPGDAAGFPVTITAAAPARSFRLASDLATTNANQTIINVSVPSVTVDLGGFRIVGPNVCSGVPVSTCSAAGTGAGVAGGNDVTVKNGAISGVGGVAVSLTYSARVEGLSIFHSGVGGIIATDLAVIRGNIVTSNAGDGIRCRDHCVVSENTATGNGRDGIEVANGTVNGNTASLNAESGGDFTGVVAFAQNQFSGNGADVTGGHASAGNACSDGSCSRRGERRFYVTTNPVTGGQALAACSAGFHMANLSEIQDTTALEYAAQLGATLGDAGAGAPTETGWVRTGGIGFASSTPGIASCLAWTSSNAANDGTVVARSSQWATAGQVSSPWFAFEDSCNNPRRVWCVED